jgi:hypothetical protein
MNLQPWYFHKIIFESSKNNDYKSLDLRLDSVETIEYTNF